MSRSHSLSRDSTEHFNASAPNQQKYQRKKRRRVTKTKGSECAIKRDWLGQVGELEVGENLCFDDPRCSRDWKIISLLFRTRCQKSFIGSSFSFDFLHPQRIEMNLARRHFESEKKPPDSWLGMDKNLVLSYYCGDKHRKLPFFV